MRLIMSTQQLIPKRPRGRPPTPGRADKPTQLVEVGVRLRARRELLGISRAEMAVLLDITEKAYGHKETGESETSTMQWKKIAEHLGAPIGYFFGEDAPADLDLEDRDTIRWLHDMAPDVRESARAAVKAMHDANARRQTTHGRKAE